MKVIKYCLSEIHDWIIRKPRSVEDVVARYTEGVRHLTSIYEETLFDSEFCSFILDWQCAVGRSKDATGRMKEDMILSYFIGTNNLYTLKVYRTCAKYCLIERMEGMTKYIVRGFARIYDEKRAEKIKQECGLK